MNSFDEIKTRTEAMTALPESLRTEILEEWNSRTKPPASLGRLEELAAWVGTVQESNPPKVSRLSLRLYAGAHGITEERVSMVPDHINGQMFRNFHHGGAAINALCRSNGIGFLALDAGIDRPTRNFLHHPAMSEAETVEAFNLGWESVPGRTDLFAVGEMGIGNTTPAAAILATITDQPIEAITGRGAGLSDEGLRRKSSTIRRALENRRSELTSPLMILGSIGGREIAAMTGAILSAAEKKIPIVLDGVICSAAAAIAFELQPLVIGRCVAGHQSTEPAHLAFLNHYGLKPLVDLDMRLGEGSGAAVAMNIVRNAVDCFNQMATFEEAGVVL